MAKAAETAPKCFVVSPIGAQGSPARKHSDMLLRAIIEPALVEHGFSVKRADQFSSPDIITSQIIDCLVNWDLVIADLTGLNPNVMYEIGIRHMSGKPIIHVAATGTELPFDNAGQRTIFFDVSDWSSIEASRKRLQESASEIIGAGYTVSNPVTHALGIRASTPDPDTSRQILEEFERRLSRVETGAANPNAGQNLTSDTARGLLDWIISEAGSSPNRTVEIPKLRRYIKVWANDLPYDEAEYVRDVVHGNRAVANRSEIYTVITEAYDLIPF